MRGKGIQIALKESPLSALAGKELTLKTPVTTAADDKFCNIFPHFRQKEGMKLHENRLPAEDSL